MPRGHVFPSPRTCLPTPISCRCRKTECMSVVRCVVNADSQRLRSARRRGSPLARNRASASPQFDQATHYQRLRISNFNWHVKMTLIQLKATFPARSVLPGECDIKQASGLAQNFFKHLPASGIFEISLFHTTHHDSCKNCLSSDLILSNQVYGV